MLSACGGCSESLRPYPGRSVRYAAFDVSFYHPVTGRGDRFTKSRRYYESIQPDIEKRNKEELFRIGKYDTSEGSAL